MRITCLPIAILVASVTSSVAFTVQNIRAVRNPSTTARYAIEAADVTSLENHEEEGTKLAKSIAGWLDIEWLPQQIHIDMGESAKRTYISQREAGVSDVMCIMTEVVEDLLKDWQKYDADAFVNAWDVANYTSDYFMWKLGVEECGCHATIFDPDKEN